MATKSKKSARKKPRGAPKPAAKSTPKRAPKSPAVAQRQQPESLRLRSLAASLTVNDLTRSIAWYRDVLRFTPGERWEDDSGKLLGIQMKAGLCDLMLSQDDFARGRDRAKGDGVRLWFATAQDIAAIAARIKTSGVRLDYEPRNTPWGDYAFAITDPDGYKITLIQEE